MRPGGRWGALAIGALVLVTLAFVGLAAAAGPAVSANATINDQAMSNADTIVVQNVTATDSSGDTTGGVVVVTRQMNPDQNGYDGIHVAGIEERNSLDDTDVVVDIVDGELPEEYAVHVHPQTAIDQGNYLDGVQAGDTISTSPTWEEIRFDAGDSSFPNGGDLLYAPGEDPGVSRIMTIYEADTSAADVSVSVDSLDSVTIQPEGSHLATFDDGGVLADDRFDPVPQGKFRVAVSTEPLDVGDRYLEDGFYSEPEVIDVVGGPLSNETGAQTFDLRGHGLSGQETLYVNVLDARPAENDNTIRGGDGDAAVSHTGDASDSFTLTVESSDLQVTNVSPQDGGLVAGDTLAVETTVENQGTADTSAQTVALEVDPQQNGTYTEVNTTTVDVAAGDSQTVTLSADTELGDSPAVDVRVTTEDDSNGATATADVAAPTPDALADVEATPAPIAPGETTTITATVENADGQALSGVDVSFAASGDNGVTVVQNTSNATGEVVATYTGAVSDAGESVPIVVDSDEGNVASKSIDVGVKDVTLSLSGPTSPVDPASGGSAATVPVTATVETVDDEPVDDVGVTFATDAGNGSLGSTSTATDADGTATVDYTVGARDWTLADGVQIDAEIAAADETATSAFAVAEPERTVTVSAANGSVSPVGSNEVTAAVTYEAPFDWISQSGDVRFLTASGEGSFDDDGSTTVVTAGADGQATVTYAPTAPVFGQQVTVVGELPGPGGEPMASDGAQFDVEAPITVDATVDLGVSTHNATDVTVRLTDGSRTVEETVSAAPGDDSVAATFGDDRTLPAGEYTVSVVEAGAAYDDSSASATVTTDPGTAESVTVDLPAESVAVQANSTLGVTAPEDGFAAFDVTYTLAGPDGATLATTNASLSAGTANSSVTFEDVPALDDGETYTVSADASGYEQANATVAVTPGGAGSVDVGTLAPRDVTVEATADLGVTAPAGGTAVEFAVVGPDGDVTGTATDALERGQSTASVRFDALPAIDDGDAYTVTANATGYDATSGTTEVAPGATATADAGTLSARNVTLDVSGQLGADAPSENFTVQVGVAEIGEEIPEQPPEPPREGELEEPVAAPTPTPVPAVYTTNVTLDAGERAVETNLSMPAVDAADGYLVALGAQGFRPTATSTDAGPGETTTAAAGTLEPMNATVTADASLEAPPGESTTLEYALVGSRGEGPVVDTVTRTVTANETAIESANLTADFRTEDTQSGGDYRVRITATDGNVNYDGATARAYGLAPGEDRVREGLELRAQNATVTAAATLSDRPGQPTAVRFDLVGANGTVLATAVADDEDAVEPDGRQTGTATLRGAFGANLTSGDGLRVVARPAAGNVDYGTDNATAFDSVHPGETANATNLSLTADAGTVTVDPSLESPANSDVNVTVTLHNADANETVTSRTVTVPADNRSAGDVTLPAPFVGEDAVPAGDEYVVRLTTNSGEYHDGSTSLGTLYPGASPSITPTLASVYTGDGGGASAGTGGGGGGGPILAGPDLTVTRATVSNATATTGETVTVTATLENDGDAEGTRSVTLTADDALFDVQTVTVDAGAERTVTLSMTPSASGDYALVVDDRSVGTLNVTEPAEPTPTPTATPDDGSTDDGESTPTPTDTPTATATEAAENGTEGGAAPAPDGGDDGDVLPLVFIALIALAALAGLGALASEEF